MENNEEKVSLVPIENLLKMSHLEQYVYRVLNYTSRYNNSNSYYYAPINLVGKYVKYPSYGDFPEAYFLLYEKEPVLWNTTMDNYKNRAARAVAVKRIAKAVNIKNFGPQHVLMKFKNLRSSYCQELKAIAESEKSGGEVHVPKVIWFSKMNSFLRPFVQSRASMRSTESNNMIFCTEGNDSLSGNSENIQLDSSILLKTDPLMSQPIWEPQTSFQTVESAQKRSFAETHQALTFTTNKNMKTEDDCEIDVNDTFAKEDLEELENFAANKDDTFDHFGRYIASLLRNLPSKNALELQQEIINLVLNAHIYPSDEFH